MTLAVLNIQHEMIENISKSKSASTDPINIVLERQVTNAVLNWPWYIIQYANSLKVYLRASGALEKILQHLGPWTVGL